MGVLNNLLPGARQVRAPLAAGYLWLLGLGLVFGSRLPSQADAQGLLHDLYRVGDLVGEVGVAFAASFLAYFLGAISISIFAAPVRWTSSVINRISDSLRIALSYYRLRPSIAQESAATINRGQSFRNELRTAWERVRGGIDDPLSAWVNEEVTRYVEARDGGLSAGPIYLPEHPRKLRDSVARESGVMRAELRVKQDQLFAEFDRYESEAELRSAIVPPLTALICILASRGASTWVLGLIGVAVIVRQAATSRRQTLDVLATALRLRLVTSPTMERFPAQDLPIARDKDRGSPSAEGSAPATR